MAKPLNIAVVGCGYWGPNLLRNFRSLRDGRVKTACDSDTKRLAHMKELYPELETTTNVADLFNDSSLQAIAIATPVHLHYELGRKSLLAGKHTFIEKPMAASVGECLDLIQVAKTQNLRLMVGHTFIYSSAVQKIKEIVDSGELGEIFYISSQRLNLGLFQKDINVAWDLAPHDISIILNLFGELPQTVNCQGKAHVFSGIEDVTNITLDFSNGGYATIQRSRRGAKERVCWSSRRPALAAAPRACPVACSIAAGGPRSSVPAASTTRPTTCAPT